MEVSFYLKRPEAKAGTAIYARISYDGARLKYYLPEKIDPKHWNKGNTPGPGEPEIYRVPRIQFEAQYH